MWRLAIGPRCRPWPSGVRSTNGIRQTTRRALAGPAHQVGPLILADPAPEPARQEWQQESSKGAERAVAHRLEGLQIVGRGDRLPGLVGGLLHLTGDGRGRRLRVVDVDAGRL